MSNVNVSMKSSLLQSVLKEVVGCETVEENLGQILFFKGIMLISHVK